MSERYRVYFHWDNRSGTTHKDVCTLEDAFIVIRKKFDSNMNVGAFHIEDMETCACSNMIFRNSIEFEEMAESGRLTIKMK